MITHHGIVVVIKRSRLRQLLPHTASAVTGCFPFLSAPPASPPHGDAPRHWLCHRVPRYGKHHFKLPRRSSTRLLHLIFAHHDSVIGLVTDSPGMAPPNSHCLGPYRLGSSLILPSSQTRDCPAMFRHRLGYPVLLNSSRYVKLARTSRSWFLTATTSYTATTQYLSCCLQWHRH